MIHRYFAPQAKNAARAIFSAPGLTTANITPAAPSASTMGAFGTRAFHAHASPRPAAGANTTYSGNKTSSLPSQRQRRQKSSAATATYDLSIDGSFPSIVIGPDESIQPQGSFAQAQAEFLDPDPEAVEALSKGLLETNTGIVAHYYMDVELQAVLDAVKRVPGLEDRIGIADSLKMGDMAVTMCKEHGAESIICLGVDFMAESVKAILGKNGCEDIPVYRATEEHIGCSLAESAEGDFYRAWLQTESAKNSLHVIYINTSLETKAVSSSVIPTITCTSSNVLSTILQASAQVPDIRILYGPDTYMGENLHTLLETVIQSNDWTDEKIVNELHADHSNATLQRLRDNLVVFPQGNCVVHHMFGDQVVQTVRDHYMDDDKCFITAHLEVPGEMFEIAMEKSLDDRGVVGSTSDILNFITRKVKRAAEASQESENPADKQRLRFILGTEAGMVTSIVKSVQSILKDTGSMSVEAEVIFPVSNDAIMVNPEDGDTGNSLDMPIVPGVSGGEGCSTAGGCATCPFMKMNDLDRVHDILDLVRDSRESESSAAHLMLTARLPPNRLQGRQINGQDAVDLGSEAIIYMRQFMQESVLPNELIQKIKSTSAKTS